MADWTKPGPVYGECDCWWSNDPRCKAGDQWPDGAHDHDCAIYTVIAYRRFRTEVCEHKNRAHYKLGGSGLVCDDCKDGPEPGRAYVDHRACSGRGWYLPNFDGKKGDGQDACQGCHGTGRVCEEMTVERFGEIVRIGLRHIHRVAAIYTDEYEAGGDYQSTTADAYWKQLDIVKEMGPQEIAFARAILPVHLGLEGV